MVGSLARTSHLSSSTSLGAPTSHFTDTFQHTAEAGPPARAGGRPAAGRPAAAWGSAAEHCSDLCGGHHNRGAAGIHSGAAHLERGASAKRQLRGVVARAMGKLLLKSWPVGEIMSNLWEGLVVEW